MLPIHLVPLLFILAWGSLSQSYGATPAVSQIPFATPTVAPVSIREFTLTASPDNLIQGVVVNVSLECAFNTNLQPSQSSFSDLNSIQILKADSNHQWNLVAEIRAYEVGIHLYDRVQGSGLIDRGISGSYLRITWPTVTNQTFGTYQCRGVGIDKTLNYAVEKSDTVVLFAHDILHRDMLDLVLREKSRLQHELDTGVKQMEEKLKNCQSSWENKYDALYQMINQSNVYNNSETWPEGTYGLLASINGCPEDRDWRIGYEKIFTNFSNGNLTDYFNETAGNNSVHPVSHLPPYTYYSEGGDNFIILTYCTKVSDTSGNPWPKGSYCIRRKELYCPKGFDYAFIGVDPDTELNEYGGDYPRHSRIREDRHYSYCCRTDGSPDVDITLPVALPFYLYRINGTCQSVADMRLTTERVTILTNNTDNHFQHFGEPDAVMTNYFISLELCYYEPR